MTNYEQKLNDFIEITRDEYVRTNLELDTINIHLRDIMIELRNIRLALESRNNESQLSPIRGFRMDDHPNGVSFIA